MGTLSRAFLATTAFICLSGCAVGPDYDQPAMAVPTVYGAASKTDAAADPEPQADYVRWWQTLHDPHLNRLIEIAVANNPDIEMALLRVQQERSQEIIARDAMLPDLNGWGTVAQGTGTDLAKGRVGNPLLAADDTRRVRQIWTIGGFDTAWEIDLFGKLQRLLAAEIDDAQAKAELRKAVMITVVAEVARAYFQIRALQIRLLIARRDVAMAQTTVDLAIDKFQRDTAKDAEKAAKKEAGKQKDGGLSKQDDDFKPASKASTSQSKSKPDSGAQDDKLAGGPPDEDDTPKQEARPEKSDSESKPKQAGKPQNDGKAESKSKPDDKDDKKDGKKPESKTSMGREAAIALARGDLAIQQARIPTIASQIAEAEGRLAKLVGVYTADVDWALDGPPKLPALPRVLRAGVPAELLRRRPDIKAAERELAAATERVGAATADLFPSVELTAGLGAQGTRGREGTTPPEVHGAIWSVGPRAYWPLLDWGRLDAQINIKEFKAHESLVKYKKTIIEAVVEVEQSIKQFRMERQRWQAHVFAEGALREAANITRQRFWRGEIEMGTLVDAQRRLYNQSEQAAIAGEAATSRYISFYKALGGGWELYDSLPPVQPAQPAVVAAFRRVSNGWHWH